MMLLHRVCNENKKKPLLAFLVLTMNAGKIKDNTKMIICFSDRLRFSTLMPCLTEVIDTARSEEVQ